MPISEIPIPVPKPFNAKLAETLAAKALTQYVADCGCRCSDDILRAITVMQHVSAVAYRAVEIGEPEIVKVITGSVQ